MLDTILEIISFIGLIILFFFIVLFLILLVKSIIWGIKDIFDPIVNEIKEYINNKIKNKRKIYG